MHEIRKRKINGFDIRVFDQFFMRKVDLLTWMFPGKGIELFFVSPADGVKLIAFQAQ